MIDHIYLPVTNIKRSLDFYSALLTPLGTADRWKFEAKAGYPDLWGFGGPQPGFWLKESNASSLALYVAFAALSEQAGNGQRCSRVTPAVPSRVLRGERLRPGRLQLGDLL